jgi:glutathionylspermidine synthase
MDTARAAGLEGKLLLINDLGWDGARFLDLEMQEIRSLCHLYPWEWMAAESFGPAIVQNAGRTRFIEPIWKMIWSNKAILEILWELFPGHPNLLWATSAAPLSDSYVRKPLQAREGANVSIVRAGVVVVGSDGPYADGPTLFQELYALPDYDGAYPVIGSWVVDGAPVGIGVREDGLITGNLARFTPHVIEG